MATEYGGFGGIAGGRPINKEDAFEMMIGRIFGDRIRGDKEFCESLARSFMNVEWINRENGDKAFYSFRAVGDMIAAIRGEGDYMDWYWAEPKGVVSEEVRRWLRKEGWVPILGEEICDYVGP